MGCRWAVCEAMKEPTRDRTLPPQRPPNAEAGTAWTVPKAIMLAISARLMFFVMVWVPCSFLKFKFGVERVLDNHPSVRGPQVLQLISEKEWARRKLHWPFTGLAVYWASQDASVSAADFSLAFGWSSFDIAAAILATYSIVPATASSGAVASSFAT